jgi:hypothetical protein
MMPGGTNTMLEIFRMAMADLTLKLKGRGFKLPRTAWFQLDNCPSENKNTVINSYMSMLVDLGYLDTVQVNYLVVGHTHCPIDQKLGALSTIIHQQEYIATPAALRHKLTELKEKGKITGKWDIFATLKHCITCLLYPRSLCADNIQESGCHL